VEGDFGVSGSHEFHSGGSLGGGSLSEFQQPGSENSGSAFEEDGSFGDFGLKSGDVDSVASGPFFDLGVYEGLELAGVGSDGLS
jgi:hypothetical protein